MRLKRTHEPVSGYLSEDTRHFKSKFHGVGEKVYINSPGDIAKLATSYIQNRILKSLEPLVSGNETALNN